MEYDITLSNKEKKHYFLYLVGMLLLAVIIVSGIFLYNMNSPFTNSDKERASRETLIEKARFEDRQKIFQPKMDSAFSIINKIPVEDKNSLEAVQVQLEVNDIGNFDENSKLTDPRKNSYARIADFYNMYLNDKKVAGGLTENIATYEKKFEECSSY